MTSPVRKSLTEPSSSGRTQPKEMPIRQPDGISTPASSPAANRIDSENRNGRPSREGRPFVGGVRSAGSAPLFRLTYARFFRYPLFVEVPGIEPGSNGADTDILRAQSR